MRRVSPYLLSVLLVAMSCDGPVAPANSDDQLAPSFSQLQTGNNAPSGPHFNLNIIGVERGHTNYKDPNGGHVIFVGLGSNGNPAKCDIDLTMGPYQVLDWSCLDGDPAAFQLPDPDENDDYALEYSVWVRALGKPNGSATAQACYEDTSGAEWCNAGSLILSLNRVVGPNGPKFYDASKELLTVCVDVDPTAAIDLKTRPLFHDSLYEYFWHYENEGLRLAQMRFYPIGTKSADDPCSRETHNSHPPTSH
jgi:hypothetical protein